VQCLGKIDSHSHNIRGRDGATRQAGAEVGSVDELHNQNRVAVEVTRVEESDERVMTEGGEKFDLGTTAFESRRVRALLGDDLECDGAPEGGVARPIDGCESASSELRLDRVSVANESARRYRA